MQAILREQHYVSSIEPGFRRVCFLLDDGVRSSDKKSNISAADVSFGASFATHVDLTHCRTTAANIFDSLTRRVTVFCSKRTTPLASEW